MTEPTREQVRQQAKRRVVAKRTFWWHLGVFAPINTMLVVIWAVTGTGYFWPGWVLLGWGVALAIHAAVVFIVMRPISEERIDREIGRRD